MKAYVCKPVKMKHTGGINCNCGPDIFPYPWDENLEYKDAMKQFTSAEYTKDYGNQTAGFHLLEDDNQNNTLISDNT